jgi:hypothetical protein
MSGKPGRALNRQAGFSAPRLKIQAICNKVTTRSLITVVLILEKYIVFEIVFYFDNPTAGKFVILPIKVLSPIFFQMNALPSVSAKIARAS